MFNPINPLPDHYLWKVTHWAGSFVWLASKGASKACRHRADMEELRKLKTRFGPIETSNVHRNTFEIWCFFGPSAHGWFVDFVQCVCTSSMVKNVERLPIEVMSYKSYIQTFFRSPSPTNPRSGGGTWKPDICHTAYLEFGSVLSFCSFSVIQKDPYTCLHSRWSKMKENVLQVISDENPWNMFVVR